MIPIPIGETWRTRTERLPPAVHRIGGSDAAALLGLCPASWGEGCTPWGMWRRARGEPIAGPDPRALPIRRGRALEPFLLAIAGADPFGGCVVDPVRPWLVGSPDGLMRRYLPVHSSVIVECKTTDDLARWGASGAIDAWDDAAPVIPPHVYVQVCIYLHLLPDAEAADVIVAGPSWPLDPVGASVVAALDDRAPGQVMPAVAAALDLRSAPEMAGIRNYRIHRNADQIAAIVAAVEEARETIMVRGERPEVDGSDDCRRVLTRAATGAPRRMTGAEAELARRYAAAKRAADAAQAELDTLANQVRAAVGSAPALIGDGQIGSGAPRVSVDATGRIRTTNL